MGIQVQPCCRGYCFPPPPPGGTECIVCGGRGLGGVAGTSCGWSHSGPVTVSDPGATIHSSGGSVTGVLSGSPACDQVLVIVKANEPGDSLEINLGEFTAKLTWGNTTGPVLGTLEVHGGGGSQVSNIAVFAGDTYYQLWLCIGTVDSPAVAGAFFIETTTGLAVSAEGASPKSDPAGSPTITGITTGTITIASIQELLTGADCGACHPKTCPICEDFASDFNTNTATTHCAFTALDSSLWGQAASNTIGWLIGTELSNATLVSGLSNPEGRPNMHFETITNVGLSGDAPDTHGGDLQWRTYGCWDGAGSSLFVETTIPDASLYGCDRVYRDLGGAKTLLGAFFNENGVNDENNVIHKLFISDDRFAWLGPLVSRIEPPLGTKAALGTGTVEDHVFFFEPQQAWLTWAANLTHAACYPCTNTCYANIALEGPPATTADESKFPCSVEVTSGTWAYNATSGVDPLGYYTTDSGAKLTAIRMHPDNILEGAANWQFDLRGPPDASGTEFVGYAQSNPITLTWHHAIGSAAGYAVHWEGTLWQIEGFGAKGYAPPASGDIYIWSGACISNGVVRLTIDPSGAGLFADDGRPWKTLALTSTAVDVPVVGSDPVFWGIGFGALTGTGYAQGFGVGLTSQVDPITRFGDPAGCIDCSTPPACEGGSQLPQQIMVTISGTSPALCNAEMGQFVGAFVLDWSGVPAGVYWLYLGPAAADLASYVDSYEALGDAATYNGGDGCCGPFGISARVAASGVVVSLWCGCISAVSSIDTTISETIDCSSFSVSGTFSGIGAGGGDFTVTVESM